MTTKKNLFSVSCFIYGFLVLPAWADVPVSNPIIGYQKGIWGTHSNRCTKDGRDIFVPCEQWEPDVTRFTGADMAYLSAGYGTNFGGVWAGSNNAGLWFGGGPQGDTRISVADGGAVIEARRITLLARNGVWFNGGVLTDLGEGAASGDAVTMGQVGRLGRSLASAYGGSSIYDEAMQTVTAGLSLDGRTYGNFQDALTDVSRRAGGGWKLTLDGLDAISFSSGGTLDLSNRDRNLRLAKTENGVVFDLQPDLVVTSLTAGDARLDTDGLSVKGGPSLTRAGIDAGGRTVARVAAGAVAKDSDDAVNGSQLHGLAESVARHLGGDATVNEDGSVRGPTYTIRGGVYGTIHDAFGAVNGNLDALGRQVTHIADGGGIRYFHAGSTRADSRATGGDSVAIGPESVAAGRESLAAGSAAVAQADGGVALGARAVAAGTGDVALGAGAKTARVIATRGVTIDGTHYDFAGAAPVATVSVGDAGAERTVTNVAAGRIDATSTDAVNGSQLDATNRAIGALNSGMSRLNGDAVKYDTDAEGRKGNTVTLQGGDPGKPVLLANVADGAADGDAVNLGQLRHSAAAVRSETKTYADGIGAEARAYADRAGSEAKAYTDREIGALGQNFERRFDGLNREIGHVRKEARQAAAIGLAASSLRYDDRPGKLSASVGGGFWQAESAVAFGLGYTDLEGRFRSSLSAVSSGGGWGVGAGLSYTFN